MEPAQSSIHIRLYKSRKTYLYVAIVLLVTGLVYLGNEYYVHYNDRFLREAESRLDMDDREGAIESIRRHILANPDDVSSKLHLAEMLDEIGQKSAAFRVYNRVATAKSIDDNSRLRAAMEISWLLDDSIETITAHIESQVDAGLFTDALASCDSIIALSERHPVLCEPFLYKDSSGLYTDSSGSIREWWSERFLLLNEQIARKAFIEWLGSKNSESSLRHLSFRYYRITNITEPKYQYGWRDYKGEFDHHKDQLDNLEDMLISFADSMFEKEDWSRSYDSWKFARDVRLRLTGGNYDHKVARLHANMGRCCTSLKRFTEAKLIYEEVRDKAPLYEVELIVEMIEISAEQVVAMEEFTEFQKGVDEWTAQRQRANELFEKKSWLQAIAAYDKTVKKLVSMGYDSCYGLVSEARYNMAISYGNHGQYEEAIDILTLLQTQCNDYEPLLVQELLKTYRR